MSRFIYISSIIALIVSCLNVSVLADAQNCIQAGAAQNVDLKNLTGVWYEQAKSVNGTTDIKPACTKLEITTDDNSKITLKVITTIESQLDNNITTSYEITTNNYPNEPMQVMLNGTRVFYFKVLINDDTANSTLSCGYKDGNQANSTFGLILTRQQMINSTYLNHLKTNYTDKFSDFGSSMLTVTQTDKCFKSSAATLSALSAFFALIFAVLQILH